MRRRVTRGIEVFRQGVAPVLVLSGGGAGSVPESEVMRTLARDAGVPEAALLVEPRSRNTFENARETAQLLHARGINAVILVSDR
ncbi:MAG: YdcF family protein, partial [Stellaceae bacterium]